MSKNLEIVIYLKVYRNRVSPPDRRNKWEAKGIMCVQKKGVGEAWWCKRESKKMTNFHACDMKQKRYEQIHDSNWVRLVRVVRLVLDLSDEFRRTTAFRRLKFLRRGGIIIVSDTCSDTYAVGVDVG